MSQNFNDNMIDAMQVDNNQPDAGNGNGNGDSGRLNDLLSSTVSRRIYIYIYISMHPRTVNTFTVRLRSFLRVVQRFLQLNGFEKPCWGTVAVPCLKGAALDIWEFELDQLLSDGGVST